MKKKSTKNGAKGKKIKKGESPMTEEKIASQSFSQ